MSRIPFQNHFLLVAFAVALFNLHVPDASAQSRIATVQGSYFGLFSNTATGRISEAVLPYIEQDNQVLAGSIINNELGFLDAFGTIHPNDQCNLISVGSGTNSVYKASWSRIGDGAGALAGPISATASGTKVGGSLVLLRPFPVTANRPSISGEYSGLGVTSAIYMKVDGIVSNSLRVDVRGGRSTTSYSAVYDVNEFGRVAGIGVRANGDIIHIDGQIQDGTSNITDGTSNTIKLNISITSASGKILFTDSIIAILIG